MSKIWTDEAARYVASETACPRCDTRLDSPGWCQNCGADLGGAVATTLRASSLLVAQSLTQRQHLIDSLPTVTASHPVVTAAVATSAVVAPAVVSAVAPLVPTRPSSQISVQSVLAIAGAALFAVAAFVFTFLNPDLTNFGTRTVILAAVTLLFLGGAWLLARRNVQFSSEAIGALGMVFLALDIWSLSTIAPPGVSGWVFAALGTLASAVVMSAVAAVARIRSWLWLALVGLSITPAFFGYAADNHWITAVGHIVVGFVALGSHQIIRRLESRFGNRLRAEHMAASVIQIIALAVVVVQLFTLDTPDVTSRVLRTTAVLAALAVLAILTRTHAPVRFWSFVAGALFLTAVSILPFALDLVDGTWYTGLVPLAGAIALTVVGAVATVTCVRPSAMVNGAWAAALAGGIPTALLAVGQIIVRIADSSASHASVRLSSDLGLATIVGLASVSLGSWALSLFPTGPQSARMAVTTRSVSLWACSLALLTLTSWNVLAHWAQAATGVVLALLVSAVLTRLPSASTARRVLRIPLSVGAHALLLLVAIIAAQDSTITVVAGVGVVVGLAAVARTVSAKVRPVHLGIGYGYALAVVATGLDLAHVDNIAVLCLTTTLASIVALGATLTRWLKVNSWYAVLIVTVIPFAIGIVSVLLVRSGWTALSTAVAFALALALVLTRRRALPRPLRAGAAALLVPALSVVVVCLGAQILTVSASPVTLPIIAVIVACTLPTTALIGSALARYGLASADARVARVWIEISSLATAAIAVLLALVRTAAGLPTTFLVLLIFGIGAAATAFVAGRRYGWWVAGASCTGALWCVWAMVGIDIVEPYLLPPALGAAVIGAVLVLCTRSGRALYATGLACAAIPSLVVLAIWGNGHDALAPWRTVGLLAGALVLVALGGMLTGTPAAARSGSARWGSARSLRTPTLFVGMAAAASGAIQAVRLGWGLDAFDVAPIQLVMTQVLVLSASAAILAAVAARLLLIDSHPMGRFSRSRWLYAPALSFLVVGPIAATRPGWFAILTLWALSIGLLTVMLVTVARARIHAVTLPPVWFIFGLAWCTAVAGWSQRDLRVEAFSLPLGLTLLAAGVIAMRRSIAIADELPLHGRLSSWPIGFRGSWHLLAPGILVTFIPSVLATATDPQTLRAILVIALALISVLVGSMRRLGAPFVLGIVVLPIENLVVFIVQLGQSIGALPWWITLATAGAVLLVIAVSYERRTTGNRGVAARLRDLT